MSIKAISNELKSLKNAPPSDVQALLMRTARAISMLPNNQNREWCLTELKEIRSGDYRIAEAITKAKEDNPTGYVSWAEKGPDPEGVSFHRSKTEHQDQMRTDACMEILGMALDSLSTIDSNKSGTVQHRGIFTNASMNQIWRDGDSGERLNGNSLIGALWLTLLQRLGEKMEMQQLENVLRNMTKREDQKSRIDIDKVHNNLIDKLTRVSGKKRSEVVSWFDKGEDYLCLKT